VVVGESDAPSTSLGAHDWGSAGDNDTVAVCLDDAGDVRWAHNIGSSADDRFASVAAAPDGSVVAVGESMGASTDPAAPSWGLEGNRDAIAVKFDATGDIAWARNYGGPDYELFFAVASLPEGGFVATGSSYGSSTNLGAHDWVHIGTNFTTDGIAVNLDGAGDVTWAANAGGESGETFLAVAAAGDGFIAAGWSNWESTNLGEHNWGHVGTGDQGDAVVVRFGTKLPPRPPATPAPPAQQPTPDIAPALPATGVAAAPWLAAIAGIALAAAGAALIGAVLLRRRMAGTACMPVTVGILPHTSPDECSSLPAHTRDTSQL
jgi:hypothetical protein